MVEAPVRQASNDGSEMEFRKLVDAIWRGKWLVIAVTVAAIVLSIVIALVLPNVYRAEALLAPSNDEGTSGLSGLMSDYGSLVSLAGLDLESGSADKITLGLNVMTSRKFISDFIAEHDILIPLVAADGWDRATGQLSLDSSLYDEQKEEWVRRPTAYRGAVPSLQEAYELFLEILSVQQDRDTGYVNISIDHYSPQLAKQWVDWIIQDVNSQVMQRDVRQASEAISYLEQKARSTSLADMQSVFYSLIEEQMKTILLAQVNPEYLFTTIDPAIAPEVPEKPNRILIVILGAMLGLLSGVLVSLGRAYFERRL